jgi:protein phosphatase PTC7
MAASSSKAVFGDVHIDDLIATCVNGLEFPKPSGVFFSDRSRSSCLKASVKMRNGELPKSRLVCGNLMLDAIRRNGKANNLVLGPLLKNLYSSSSVCVFGRAAQDVSFDGNSSEEQSVDSTVVSGLYVLSPCLCFNSSFLVTHFTVQISLLSNTELWYKHYWFPYILQWIWQW